MKKILEPKLSGMGVPETDPDYKVPVFWLMESKSTTEGQELREQIKDKDDFQSDFTGASAAECQRAALEHVKHDGMPSRNLLAIADDRTARDGTILLQYHEPSDRSEQEYEGFGVLPKEAGKWYDFRIDPEYANYADTSLSGFGVDEKTKPVWFGCKDELTDKNGVFDAARADKIERGHEPFPGREEGLGQERGTSFFHNLIAAQDEPE